MPRIALAQLNLWVGDLVGNADQIITAATEARAAGASLLVCPELALCAYPPDDLLLRHGFATAVDDELSRIAAAATGIGILVGYPEYADGAVYNSAVLLRDGGRLANYRKSELPNYGVFDERRHFIPGNAPCVIDVDGLSIGVTICEDLWFPGPAAAARAAGARVLVNLNASPFAINKARRRREMLGNRIAETGLGILYVNCVGGQDEVVFDGDSLALDRTGVTALSAACFRPGLGFVDIDSEGAIRGLDAGQGFSIGGASHQEDADAAQLYAAIHCGLADYLRRNGFARVYLGVSGGIDSALTLALAVDAAGPDRVHAVAMPSRYSADMSLEDAAEQAARMGCSFSSIEIEPGFAAMQEMLAPAFADTEPGIAEENMQSRLRGGLLMALANKFDGLVLATGNKSEMAVGYATLYGDMCGGYAPLKDLYKTQVYALARWRNESHEVIPPRVLSRAPSAELRPDQKDADSLPPYERLDPILSAYIESQQSIPEIVAAGYAEDEVRRVVGLIRRAEYKRRQAAPGPKVSVCAFGRERRFPISARYGDW